MYLVQPSNGSDAFTVEIPRGEESQREMESQDDSDVSSGSLWPALHHLRRGGLECGSRIRRSQRDTGATAGCASEFELHRKGDQSGRVRPAERPVPLRGRSALELA